MEFYAAVIEQYLDEDSSTQMIQDDIIVLPLIENEEASFDDEMFLSAQDLKNYLKITSLFSMRLHVIQMIVNHYLF